MAGLDFSTMNDGQKEIVTTLDRPLFVEAGAGSGKTYTLTQRIAWALTEGSGRDGAAYLDDVSQILVITFTNAAAREIKERVRSTLRAQGMNGQALKVDSAWISTIHGMCSRILRRHALDLGIDPAFRIASGNEADELLYEAALEVAGDARRSSRKTPGMEALFRDFDFGARMQGGDYTGILAAALALRQSAIASPGGFADLWVPPAAEPSSVIEEVERAFGALSAQKLTPKAKDAVMPSLEALSAFLALAPGERTSGRAGETLACVKLPSYSKAIAEARGEAKAELALAHAELALGATRPAMEALVELAQGIDSRYRALKRKSSLLDNDDLISEALSALESSPEVAADYEGRFRLVMVDEFQDTDAKQLKLISMLSAGGQQLTTVGDSQQSIYRFRGADVSVFHGRGADLPDEDRVQLAVNYRSHADILAFVDRVCGGEKGVLDHFMHLDPDGSEKSRRRHEMGYPAKGLPRIDVELSVAGRGATQAQRAVGALAIATRLRAYADAGIDPGRMALLLRAGTHADLYIDAIRKVGLECIVTGGSSFTSTAEARAMQALLHYLANAHDTASGLFPLLASPIFGLAADDFICLATTSQPKIDAPAKRSVARGFETMQFRGQKEPSLRLARAHDILVRARQMARRHPVADACTFVVRESGWLSRLASEGAEGLAKSANVMAALRYIRDLTQDLGLGPARAAGEFDRWLQISKIPPATLSGGRSSAVQVMTVHASKGLQFGVVAVAECWADPLGATIAEGSSGRDGRRTVIVPPKDFAYAAPDEVPEDPKTLGEWYAKLRADDHDSEAAEATRLLYVALTRAEEALILGISASRLKDGALRPQLAAAVADDLFGPELPEPGTSWLGYGGSAKACVHTVRIEPQTLEDGSKGLLCDTGGVLPEAEGLLPEDPASLVAPVADSEAEPSFCLFEREEDRLASETRLGRLREGVFSYSGARERMAEMAGPDFAGPGEMDSLAARIPARAERAAEQEGAPQPLDEDKATNLGSAFHILAQGMAETGQFPDEGRIAAMARRWRLSRRAEGRLRTALGRWWGSSVRKEAFAYEHHAAEMPFFSRAHSALGDYVEGAFDLLAWNDCGHALLVDYKTGDTTLTGEEIYARHHLQADLYARVLQDAGFAEVECRFVCVELADAEAPAEPFCVAYRYDGQHEAKRW